MSEHQNDIVATLKSSAMFCELSDEHVSALAGVAEVRSAATGKMLYTQSTSADGMFVVRTGQVKVFQTSPDGKEFILHIVGPGGTFSEAPALSGLACPASAVMIDGGELVFLPAVAFRRLLSTSAELCMAMLKALASHQCGLVRTLENIVLRDAMGRLAGYLLTLMPATAAADEASVVRLPIKKRDLAAYLALTPETLSRTLGRLVELHAIRQDDGGDIELLHPETLRGLATQ